MTTDVRPKLLTFDVHKTLADIDGDSHVKRICRASPLPDSEVRRVLYDDLNLKTMPSVSTLTPEIIEETCHRLRIEPAEFLFGRVSPAPYRLRPDARDVVAVAAGHLDVAIVTNASVFADHCLLPVREGLHPYLAAVYTSWSIGAAKPDTKIFQVAARRHGLTPEDLIHVGNSWHHDIAPMLELGGRAVWLNQRHDPIPDLEPLGHDRLLVAHTLAVGVDQAIRRWLC